MKKLLACFLCIAALPLTALAEDAIMPLEPRGDSVDLDGDGVPENVSLEIQPSDAEETFTLTVNDASESGCGVSLNGDLYAVTQGRNVYLVTSEMGPSDDPCCFFYRYDQGHLDPIGCIPSTIDSIKVTREGFTATVRGRVLQTWFRPADYIVATGGRFDETTGQYVESVPVMVEVPRPVYPMGTIVTLNTDLDLWVSPVNDSVVTIKKGTSAVLAATDDLEWVYIISNDASDPAEGYRSGWLRLLDSFYVSTPDGELPSWEAFDGLFLAD